jgi:NAD(P)H-flavin reductase
LEREKIKELTKAVGLVANGIGIGSFVYLRRVFESLIEEAHNEAKVDSGWDEAQYQKNRMVEKIEQLKNHLPDFLVKNKGMYGILSVGIHELEENECLKHFDAVKVGIELILDEKLEKRNKAKKIEEAQNRIQVITQSITKK